MSVNREDDADGSMSADSDRLSPGARLSAARKERELTLKAVADELKLDVRMVEALEQDNRDALPEPIFVKGYLRRYARLTGLPEDELIRDYSGSLGEPPPLSVVAIKTRKSYIGLPSARLLRNLMLLLLAGLIVWQAYPYIERFLASRGQSVEKTAPGHLDLPPANQLVLPQERER
jgi:cytoskeleton protein RodZ